MSATDKHAGERVQNRLDEVFVRCREENRAALVLFLTAGFPNLEMTRKLLPVIAEAGCDILELGVPFSDPIADGPVIQHSSAVALAAGTTFPKTLDALKELRTVSSMPVVMFGALNPYLARGFDNSARMIAEAGGQGVLAADLPSDEADEFRETLNNHGLHLITLAAPTTPDKRLGKITQNSSGFIYCIAMKGTTGAQQGVQSTAKAYLDRLRTHTNLPLALGFGISTPEHVAAATAAGADGIVVGSALIRVIQDAQDQGKDVPAAVGSYVRSLVAALKK